jgi:hypothetical protein
MIVTMTLLTVTTTTVVVVTAMTVRISIYQTIRTVVRAGMVRAGMIRQVMEGTIRPMTQVTPATRPAIRPAIRPVMTGLAQWKSKTALVHLVVGLLLHKRLRLRQQRSLLLAQERP